MVSADGKPSVPLNQNQRLVIHKHPNKLTLLHPPGVGFLKLAVLSSVGIATLKNLVWIIK